VLAVTMVICGFVLVVAAARMIVDEVQYRWNGVATLGVIYDVKTLTLQEGGTGVLWPGAGGYRSSTSYLVRYYYKVAGETYQGRRRLFRLPSYSTDQRVRVWYLKSDPAQSRLRQPGWGVAGCTMVVGILLVIASNRLG
jgi:uncharacterized protein DUF3592